jgi:Peptidase MA superfamily
LTLALAQAPRGAIQLGQVTVVASPAHQSVALALAEGAERPRLWPGLGRRAPPPFLLVLADDSAALARLTRGRAPGWGAGVTFPGASTILLRADLPDLEQTLHHELAHLILRTVIHGRLPLWFDEGYAAWASGELGRMEGLELNLAVASGRVPSLDQLDAMLRGSATSADLAYALAASAVAEIAKRPPPGGLEPLLNRLAAGVGFDTALVEATGLSVDRFEETWQQGLRRKYSFLTWLVAGGMWTIIALSLGGMVWYRRRRDRPRRVALDQGWVILPETPLPVDESDAPVDPPVDPGASPQ